MNKSIGEKLKEIRERYNFSQEEVSEYLWINRVVLANIEANKRKVKPTDQLTIKIHQLFEIDEDELLGRISLEKISKISSKDKFYKFKNTILYILSKCGGKINIDSVFLNRLLYFCDFNYYENTQESITGEKYIKLIKWPKPENIEKVLEQMEEVNQITRIETNFNGKNQVRFLVNKKANLMKFTWLEVEVINNTINRLSDMSLEQINNYSSEDIPCKMTEKLWDFINYKSFIYRTVSYLFSCDNY